MLLSLIFSLLIAFLIYKCFENYGFKVGFFVALALNLISMFIQNGTAHILRNLIVTVFVSFVITSIDYWIFQKTNSFWSYIGLSFLIGILFIFVMSFIITALVAGSGLLA